MKSLKIYTKKRCPKCCSNDFGVQETSTVKQYYRVHEGGVEIIPFMDNRTYRSYQFKCKECGHEWTSEEFVINQN